MNGRLAVVMGLVLLASTGALPHTLCAQGTQAAAHLEHQRAALARDSLIRLRNRALGYSAEREAFERRVDARAGADDADYRRRALRVVELGRELQRTPVEDRSFRQLLRDFTAEAEALDRNTPTIGTRSAVERAQVDVSPLVMPPTFPGAISPNVAFTLGVGTPPCNRCGVGVELGTNLVGSAVGAAVGALGAPDGLKGYFEKNIAIGLTLTTRKTSRITSALSVGLGSVDVLSHGVWPMLGIEQFDSSDVGLPEEVRARDQAQGTWSSPQIGVGFTWHTKSQVRERLQQNKAVPILSLGVRLPQYYPGSAPAALAALFNGNEHKFEGAHRARFFASISIPLFRADGG